MAIKILIPGALTTVQDLGRFGFQQSGIPCSGVMDRQAFRAANYLVGNSGNEAVLEHTLFGGTCRFETETIFALTGADMNPLLNGKSCPMYRPISAPAGSTLTLGIASRGCRTYLAVSGGIAVLPVMGSRSTYIKCGIGGFHGRQLCAGDILETGNSSASFEALSQRVLSAPVYSSSVTVRVIPGPQEDAFTAAGIQTFYTESYTVSEKSDRMGCRLDGPAVESLHGTDIISDGIVFGSIQITSAGQPIILLADRQTTGGYAKIGTVCSVDLPLLAQCRPGNTLRFKKITVTEAQQLLQDDSLPGKEN